ncbi:MAG: hypothetical protein RIA09_08755 [Hoeflea sp.]|jgi:hypothetical protein|uniref:hypothetical protein n=1 Tax=Hoeflea sp. TaxID=1940281 RepID=UPI0032EB1B08
MSTSFATQQSGIESQARPHGIRSRDVLSLAAAALGMIVVSMLTGLAFAAWTSNGPALLNVLAASGLSWCL